MSKITSPYGKPLKGLSSATTLSSGDTSTAVIAAISNGSITMNNIEIAGGVINNVTIGVDGSGPINATTITTGAPTGVGYDVIFYGDTVGEYASWTASLGLWTISGDTIVYGITDLGNIRIAGNTISSTNINGDIILDPAGTGCVIINSCIDQSSTTGDVTFNVANGVFDATSDGNVGLTSTSGKINLISKEKASLVSNNGDIIISSGTSKTTSGIVNISTGSSPILTTSSASGVEVGDSINILGTNSVPDINGNYTVTSVVDSLNFRITPGFSVSSQGTSGSFTKNTDIYLTSSGNINIPYDVKLTLGSDSNYIVGAVNELSVVSGSDINLTPGVNSDINIPANIGLTFGSDSCKIEGDGTGIAITSSNVSFTDPILKLDSATPVSNNGKDKGIEFNYFNGTSQLGWFGYDNSTDSFAFFKSATNNSEVISGTLGNASFATGNFTSLSGGSISSSQIDTCNINCNGLLTLTGASGIKLNTTNVIIPQGTFLKFGETGSPNTVIYKEASGSDLVIQSQSQIFLTPTSGSDVILPTNSGLVLNGEMGSQYIKSISSTEMTISSSSFLNLSQISGGVRLNEGLPLILNQNETTKLSGDSAGNLLVNAENSINLLPSSGQVSIPVNKRIELGSATSYIGSTGTNQVVLNTPGTFTSSSTGNTSINSSADIFISPSGSVILPKNKAIQLGDSTEFIKSDLTGDLTYSSSGSQSLIASSINLSPSTFVNIPYTKPLQFGSSSESITGTSGNLALTAGTTSLSGNLTVNGGSTLIHSTSVAFDDPILTIGLGVVDAKDRGIEYKYSNKLGFFGMDDTDKTFMYIPDAVNIGEVITGALGNVKFGSGSFTGLSLNNGNISQVNTLSSTGQLTLQPGSGNDLVFSVDSGRNVTIPVNVDLLFGGETNKIYSDGTNLHVVDNLVVDGGTTVNGDLTVTGNISVAGGSTVNFTVHRFSVSGGGSQSPNSSSNVTFITVNSSGVATGILPIGNIDGFIKNVCMSSIATGGSYELTFPSGRLLDPGTGTTVAKKMVFDTPGQSVQLVWDHSLGTYIITQGGTELVLV